MVQTMLERSGCFVVWTPRVHKAAKLASEEPFDGAILDINVAGHLVYPVAEELRQRAIRFVFMTAYEPLTLPDEYRACSLIQKPVSEQNLALTVNYFRRAVLQPAEA